MSDRDLDQRLQQIEQALIEITTQMKRLRGSDRRQWHKIEAQRRYTLVFFAVVGLGAMLGFSSLESDDRAALERVAVAVIVAGGAGVLGVNTNQFRPPGDDLEDED